MNSIVLSENQSAECPHCGKNTSCTLSDDIIACTHCGKAVECIRDENSNITLGPAPAAFPGPQKTRRKPGYYDDGDTISWYEY